MIIPARIVQHTLSALERTALDAYLQQPAS